MKLKYFNPEKARVLHDFVAFKWIKSDRVKTQYLDIYIPQKTYDGGGEGRLGHRYTCEILAVGPKVTTARPGDRFMLHEYDKVDQSTPWHEDHVMFCEEKVISAIFPKDTEITTFAKEITDKMMDKYEDY